MLSGAFFGALLLATSSLVSAACPPAPVGSSIYTVDPITVTTKSGGKASDISFTINTGSGTIACTPDRSLLDRFEEGERFECKGLGKGRYEFAYYKGTQNAIWLRFDGYLSRAIAGTAPVALNCTGTQCHNVCPAYVAMLREDPDD